MVTRKKSGPSDEGAGSILSTVSGPSNAPPPGTLGDMNPVQERLLEKMVAGAQLAGEMAYNANKAAEHGDAARTPPVGETRDPSTHAITGSTASEITTSPKVGAGAPPPGFNPTVDPLDRVRVDGEGQRLTTNQGVPVADNQNSLKIGLRGPTAMEDFILREKLTHFDHERIPERVVHARGSAAHGFFESYKDLSALTRASIFAEPGKQTPVFVRFSTLR